MELKNTLTMPKTTFEMRGNLPSKEPVLQARWSKEELYQRRLEKNKANRSFLLHDGPPYANGDIHVGHALNKILKDFVIRYHNMKGDYSPYIPGWDTHGLPIESVLQKQGVNRKSMPLSDYRILCAEYALSQVERQKKQFMRLGSMGDYDHPYITLTKDFEAVQLRVFATMALKGLIYKGAKPVYWSPSSESALAEAEIEYHDVSSYSIYVSFHVQTRNKDLKGDESFVIWTTTPWTLPANLAVCLNPTLTYGIYDSDQGVFIFLESLAESLQATLQLTNMKLRKTLIGAALEGVTTKHPFYERESLVILGDHVTADTGTGCVHTAPGHGEDDFLVGRQYHLPPFCPVDEKGMMTEDAGADLAGIFYEKANDVVLEKLKSTGALLQVGRINHSYPHDWRTKKPVIFRATAQWFASIDAIREQLLQEIKTIKWLPTWGELRLTNMIADRDDWCISRQRAWGVPIPIMYAEDDTPLMEKELFDHFEQLFREYGSNIWFIKDAKDLLPAGYHNSHSPNGIFRKETDIMDVWFDSGSTHTSVLLEREMGYPADLYLEGSDQYRGWFNSSLIIGTAIHGKSPYKAIVSHGFVLDGNGNKMSKSLGNTVDPNKVIEQYGADILRLWVASVDYQSDVRISDSILKQSAEAYRKIRNTFRFLLGNLSDGSFGNFDFKKDAVTTFERVDEFVIAKLHDIVNRSLEAYERYDYAGVLQEIMNFMSADLSSFYLDITKDILYCDYKGALRRRQVQTVLAECLDSLLRLLAPILPHTCEEIYDHFTERKESSVHLLSMVKQQNVDTKALQDYELVLQLRGDVLKALEQARTGGLIGSSQEASVVLDIMKPEITAIYHCLPAVEKSRFFIVSSVSEGKNNGTTYDVAKVQVNIHQGVRCERCWNRYDSHEMKGMLCSRCDEAVKRYEQEV